MAMRTRLITTSAFLVLAQAVSVTHAQDFEEDFDGKKAWQELAVQLPAAPAEANLLSFYVSPTATQTFAIDTKSITVGADGVIRYTLVATGSAGARNISYEGIRCESFEKKLYAFGQADGSWSRARRDQWERIVTGTANSHHARLAQDYFCQNLTVAGSATDILQRIRSRRPLTDSLYN